jgi:hypothetical protein
VPPQRADTIAMRLLAGLASAALLAAAFGAPSASAAVVDLGPLGSLAIVTADDNSLEDAPATTTRAATSVGSGTATLNGKVNPRERPTTYHFEWGLTTAYGSKSTETSAGKGDNGVVVSATVAGLQPEATYHFRLVAKSDKGTVNGADLTFTTAAAETPAGGGDGGTPTADPGDGTPTTEPGDGSSGGTGSGDDTLGGDLGSGSQPQLGQEFAAAPAGGTVLVDQPGPGGFEPLPAGAAVPVGSVVDARNGTASITTELDSGRTQTAQFWGAVFKVRQRSDEGGVTEIVLRGAPDCKAPAATGKKIVSSSHKRRRGGLWGRDTKGRWRTRGRGSQATTRGTRWYTEERCDGTYTKVTEGAVDVQDFATKRTVLVKAGRSYLARVRSHH